MERAHLGSVRIKEIPIDVAKRGNGVPGRIFCPHLQAPATLLRGQTDSLDNLKDVGLLISSELLQQVR